MQKLIDNIAKRLSREGISKNTIKDVEEIVLNDYLQLLSTSGLGLVLCHESGKIDKINDVARFFMGYSDINEIPESIEELFPKKEIADVMVAFKNAIAKEEPQEVEMLIHIEDQVKWLSVVFSKRAGCDKDSPYLQITFTDISKRKRTEDYVNEQNSFYTTVMDSITNPLMVIDSKSYDVVMLNKAAKNSSGYNEKTTINKCYEISHNRQEPCNCESHKCPVEIVVSTGKEVTVEHVHSGNNGKDRVIEVTAYPVPNRAGNIDKVIEYSADVTEKRDVELKLRESETRLREIVNATFEGVVIHNGGVILDINDQVCEISGYRREDMLNKNLISFVPAEEFENVNKAMTSSEHVKYETKIIHSSGKLIDVEINSKAFGNKRVAAMRDVTERKRAEKKLIDSEVKFRVAFENASLAMALVNSEGYFIETNKVFRDLFGYPDEDIIGFKFSKITHPDDIEKSDAFVAELRKGNRFFGKIQKKYITFTNNTVWGETSISVVKGSKEEPSLFIVQINDITNKQKDEREIQKLLTAIEQSANSVVITDTDGRIEYVNKKFTEVTGYTVEEAIGNKPSVLKSGEMEEVLYKDLWKTIISGETWKGQFINRKKSGDLYWESATITPVLDENGKAIHYIAIKEDITRRKEAEESLNLELVVNQTLVEISKKLLSEEYDIVQICGFILEAGLALTNSESGFVGEIDPGNDDLVIRAVGGNFTADSEISNKELRFKKENDIYPSLWGHPLNTLTPVFTNDPGKHKASRGIPAGHVQLNSFISAPAYIDNTLLGQVSFANRKGGYTERDLKIVSQVGQLLALAIEHRRGQMKLKMERDRAEKADKLKSIFLANMSHEIRTPMNSIVGFSDLLTRSNLPAEKTERYVGIIQRNSKSLLNLINDIIDISKIELEQISLEKIPCSVNEMVESVYLDYNAYRQQFNRTNIDLELVVPKEHPDLRIISDPVRVKQVLTNLVGNAMKFTEKGSVKLGYTIDNDFIEFFVSDTGIGISEDKVEEVFKLFRQADSSMTRKYGGTGLGLAISKALVELLGGKIWTKSVPDEGSTFYFTIPNVPAENERSEEIDNEISINFSGKTILVAEDVPTVFEYIRDLLSDYQPKIIHARNGKEAVDFVNRYPEIDVVLMDIQMPVMNGYDAIRLIKKVRVNLPVIAQTAFAMVEEKKKCFDAGCDDFVTKPIEQEKLLSVLKKFLS